MRRIRYPGLTVGVVLVSGNFFTCDFNLFHRPHSWFDLFTQMEGPPQNLAEWQAALADMER